MERGRTFKVGIKKGRVNFCTGEGNMNAGKKIRDERYRKKF